MFEVLGTARTARPNLETEAGVVYCVESHRPIVGCPRRLYNPCWECRRASNGKRDLRHVDLSRRTIGKFPNFTEGFEGSEALPRILADRSGSIRDTSPNAWASHLVEPPQWTAHGGIPHLQGGSVPLRVAGCAWFAG